jgi:hypothetical protein
MLLMNKLLYRTVSVDFDLLAVSVVLCVVTSVSVVMFGTVNVSFHI